MGYVTPDVLFGRITRWLVIIKGFQSSNEDEAVLCFCAKSSLFEVERSISVLCDHEECNWSLLDDISW